MDVKVLCFLNLLPNGAPVLTALRHGVNVDEAGQIMTIDATFKVVRLSNAPEKSRMNR